MQRRISGRICSLLVGYILVASIQVPALAQSGHVLDAAGPVNQSMGGAGTAMPLDAMGALHWNPASVTGLRSSEIGFAFQIFAPETRLYSSVLPGAFGPGIPAAGVSGWTTSDTDISPIPSLAFVCRRPDSPWTYGISGLGIGGFGVDFPATPGNPITTPQPRGASALGPSSLNSNSSKLRQPWPTSCPTAYPSALG